MGFIVTVLFTFGEGPLHPFAVTSISTTPTKSFAHTIKPLFVSIFPAKVLEIDQLNPVLFEAVVEYFVMLPKVLQIGSTPDSILIAVGVPTVGVTVTGSIFSSLFKLHPFSAVTTIFPDSVPISTVILNSFDKVCTVFPVTKGVTIFQSGGTVQLYLEAFETAEIV